MPVRHYEYHDIEQMLKKPAQIMKHLIVGGLNFFSSF